MGYYEMKLLLKGSLRAIKSKKRLKNPCGIPTFVSWSEDARFANFYL